MTASQPRRQRRAPQPGPALPTAGATASALELAALAGAMRHLMAPLATLAIARGVPFVVLQDLLKTAFVDAASAAHPQLPEHRKVSRISTATGLSRREVTRLTQAGRTAPRVHRSPATRVFTKWIAEPALRTAQGEVIDLPRQGPAPSFESLARSVTGDVHPRSLLDELCRLGLARVDGDTVQVQRDRFVPRGDGERLLGLLGSNVGDHLRAAVANVLADEPAHLEQAVFADELSLSSVDALRQLMRTQWKTLLAAAVPALDKLIAQDRAAGRPQDQRVRVGLYTYGEPMPSDTASGVPIANPERKAALKPRTK